jgi:hypothetical protein
MARDQTFTFRISGDMKAALARAAAADDRTSGQLVIKLLREFLVAGGYLGAPGEAAGQKRGRQK